MISIGRGTFLQPGVPAAIIPDTWPNGIGIFDMTDLSWSNSYNSNAMPYEQSNVVKRYYQSNPGTPTWNDPALAEVFATNTSSKGSSASTTHTPAPKQHGVDTGATVGGVVGGLTGLCAILSLAAFFLRRRRQNHKSSSDGSKNTASYIEMSGEPSHNELGPSPEYEMGPPPSHELGPPPRHELGACSPHNGRAESAL